MLPKQILNGQAFPRHQCRVPKTLRHKAQRLLASIDTSFGPVYTHGAVERVNGIYRRIRSMRLLFCIAECSLSGGDC
jgi:hypothetical protein